MNGTGTLWLDVSFTRTQSGTDIGITRTVRRLFDGLVTVGAQPRAAAFASGGFREVPLPVAPPVARTHDRRASQRIFGWIHGSFMRRLVSAALRVLPWSLLRPFWQRASVATFDGLARDLAPIRFAKGDILFIVDASWNYPVWTAARHARAQGASVVLLVYDLMPIRRPEFCFPLVPRLFPAWLAQTAAVSDAIVGISRATERDVADWLLEHRLPQPPAGHFRLGADPSTIASGAAVRAAITGVLDGAVPCFAAVGSIEPKKNYGLLLDVFEALWQQGFAGRLLLVGRMPPDWPAMARRLRSHAELGRRLFVIHDATDAEVLAIYERCTALLLPSLFEGFGLSLVEARTRGCAVIASNLPCFVELADEGVTLFDLRSPEELTRAVLEHADPGRIAKPAPMAPVTWVDSARACMQEIERLLAGARGVSPGADWGYSRASGFTTSAAAPMPRGSAPKRP